MKAVFAVCFIALVSSAYGLTNTDIVKAIRECKKQYNCKENLLGLLKRNEIPTTNEGFESMYCAAQKIGMISDGPQCTVNTGVMTEVFIKMHMDQQGSESATQKCKDSCTGGSNAEKAQNVMTCIKTNAQH